MKIYRTTWEDGSLTITASKNTKQLIKQLDSVGELETVFCIEELDTKSGLIIECTPKKDTGDDEMYYETYLHNNEIVDNKGTSIIISKDELPESFRFIVYKDLREFL